jgi:hypothetical protein
MKQWGLEADEDAHAIMVQMCGEGLSSDEVDLDGLHNMMLDMQQCVMEPSEATVRKVERAFNNPALKGAYHTTRSSVSHSGKLSCCGRQLDLMGLTASERRQMKSKLVKLVRGESAKQEQHLLHFDKWLHDRNKLASEAYDQADEQASIERASHPLHTADPSVAFHYVVDGPNIAYRHQNFTGGAFSFKQIEVVLQHLQAEMPGLRPLLIMPDKYMRKKIPNHTQPYVPKGPRSKQTREEEIADLFDQCTEGAAEVGDKVWQESWLRVDSAVYESLIDEADGSGYMEVARQPVGLGVIELHTVEGKPGEGGVLTREAIATGTVSTGPDRGKRFLALSNEEQLVQELLSGRDHEGVVVELFSGIPVADGELEKTHFRPYEKQCASGETWAEIVAAYDKRGSDASVGKSGAPNSRRAGDRGGGGSASASVGSPQQSMPPGAGRKVPQKMSQKVPQKVPQKMPPTKVSFQSPTRKHTKQITINHADALLFADFKVILGEKLGLHKVAAGYLKFAYKDDMGGHVVVDCDRTLTEFLLHHASTRKLYCNDPQHAGTQERIKQGKRGIGGTAGRPAMTTVSAEDQRLVKKWEQQGIIYRCPAGANDDWYVS